MNYYAKTSRHAGQGFRRMQTVRRDYRAAAEARQAAHDRLCAIHAAGADITEAKQSAAQADSLFWHLDHSFRRYKAFYRNRNRNRNR
jgi:hypothetical protein